MSYLTQSKMAQDYGLIMRIAACAATEGVTGNPSSWADDRRQKIVASDGWAEAYAQAVTDGVEAPCEDDGAVTDAMVLSAVQSILAREASPTYPEPNLDGDEVY